MPKLRFLLSAALVVVSAIGFGCDSSPQAGSNAATSEAADWADMGPSRVVTLPDGFEVTAELKVSDQERGQGMMYRSTLPLDKGMLFVFDEVIAQPFWMYNTYVPLDIIWLDDTQTVVEISANTPPCGSRDARDCPNFGGSVPALYVLEIAAGQAALHGVEVGSRLKF